MILMIHVPKTAGTSLRLALAKTCGKRRIALDYGADSGVTSTVVQNHLYRTTLNEPRKSLLAALESDNYEVLAGHFPYRKYGWHFRSREIVTCIREPIHRLASEYLHAKRLQGYRGTFESFIRQPAHQNKQARLLEGLPARAFVGITERYGDSMRLLSRRLGFTVQITRRNVAPAGGARKFVASLDAELIALARKLNDTDIALYEHRLSAFHRMLERETCA